MTERLETFLEGASAFVNLYGVMPIMNPYPDGSEKSSDWYAGFYAARNYKSIVIQEENG